MRVKLTLADASPAETRVRPVPRRGVAVVEFAVVASLLFVLILGIIEFGRAMMVLEMLNNAARNGARIGVLNGSATSDVNSAVTNALAGAGFSGVQTTVQVNGVTADANTAVSGDAVTVMVKVPYNNVTWLPTSMFLAGKTLGSTVVMRRE
ncbi:MAG TPA: TadE/TadG family type IV pilus assembly protein [Gemmataceae bacterium]|jgi:Flp pilus assembly protein TadG|nr:TadE/TadG family type IV pilus assembly protein [Gemmataceae bacterium]